MLPLGRCDSGLQEMLFFHTEETCCFIPETKFLQKRTLLFRRFQKQRVVFIPKTEVILHSRFFSTCSLLRNIPDQVKDPGIPSFPAVRRIPICVLLPGKFFKPRSRVPSPPFLRIGKPVRKSKPVYKMIVSLSFLLEGRPRMAQQQRQLLMLDPIQLSVLQNKI